MRRRWRSSRRSLTGIKGSLFLPERLDERPCLLPSLHSGRGLGTLNRCVQGRSLDSHRHHGFWTRPRYCVRQSFLPMCARLRVPRKAGLATAVGDEETWERNSARILRRRARL
jgi:hypothetical protein